MEEWPDKLRKKTIVVQSNNFSSNMYNNRTSNTYEIARQQHYWSSWNNVWAILKLTGWSISKNNDNDPIAEDLTLLTSVTKASIAQAWDTTIF